MSGDNDLLWSQFCRLGEMIGDGLHYEEPWISKEYNKLARILMPDAYSDLDKLKRESTNKAVADKLINDRCTKCSGSLAQVRSGSRVVKCTSCGAKFRYKVRKK